MIELEESIQTELDHQLGLTKHTQAQCARLLERFKRGDVIALPDAIAMDIVTLSQRCGNLRRGQFGDGTRYPIKSCYVPGKPYKQYWLDRNSTKTEEIKP